MLNSLRRVVIFFSFLFFAFIIRCLRQRKEKEREKDERMKGRENKKRVYVLTEYIYPYFCVVMAYSSLESQDIFQQLAKQCLP